MNKWLLFLAIGFCARWAVLAGDYASGIQVGQIAESSMAELSGIAASRQNPGVLWTHNDRARDQVFAVSTNGQLLATWTFGGDVSDFEDIAVGPGPQPDLQYVYCGDIGDNFAVRPSIRVYRAAEPAVYIYQAANPTTPKFPMVEKFTFFYPDHPHNAEALLVDPWTSDIYVATKETAISRIFRAQAADLHDGAEVTLTLVSEVKFDVVSAGDISLDGREILLRQEEFARVWARSVGQSVSDAFESVPTEAPVIGTPVEPNGEGVGFAGDGTGYYTVSEGVEPSIYFFAKTNHVQALSVRMIVEPASDWKYLDNGSDQQTAWQLPGFADGAWKTGKGQLGYGDNDQQTEISYGKDKDKKHVTTYFRKAFVMDDPSGFDSLNLRVVYDDGVAVYLNGTELIRTNLAPAALSSDPALASASSQENLWHTFLVPNTLQAGTNTLAVEVHRYSRSEGDLSFDLQLLGNLGTPKLQFVGPPKLQSDASWRFDLRGPAQAQVDVQRSTNLVNWPTVSTLFLTNGTGTVSISRSEDSTVFFRLHEH